MLTINNTASVSHQQSCCIVDGKPEQCYIIPDTILRLPLLYNSTHNSKISCVIYCLWVLMSVTKLKKDIWSDSYVDLVTFSPNFNEDEEALFKTKLVKIVQFCGYISWHCSHCLL
jgi:hypothetical protein